MSTLRADFLVVAAIDFGTAYSGYAFSSIREFKTDPLKISANTWIGGSLMSQKTSTCVLFDKDKTLKKFGFDAEDAYADLAMDDKHKDYYYFRRFKMELFNKLKLKRRFMLEDVMGKKMLAMDVFSACIEFLKDDCMAKIRLQLPDIRDTDIRWVLTVPAIWNDVSKQFMRESAAKAGIPNESLLIALEPEAASLCCRYSPMTSLTGSQKFMPFQPGTKYLIFDAGGGTIDITVHEVMPGGGLKELYAANGGDWGGTYVDRAFRNLLAEIVGNDIMAGIETSKTSDYIDIFRDFEVIKRKFAVSMSDKVTFKVPAVLNEIFKAKHGKDIKDQLPSLAKYKDKITWLTDKIRIEADVAKGLFKDACDQSSKHLASLFLKDELKGVDTVLMVGGFSESPMLQKRIQESVPQDKKFIIPKEPGLAVLKGAVIFGHNPLVIEARRARYTYGVGTSVIFEDGKHPESKRFTNDEGEDYCDDIFDEHVTIGQELVLGKTNLDRQYTPVHKDQKQMTFEFYASTDPNPTFVSDANCTEIGQFTVDLADSDDARAFSVTMIFGDTELHAEAVEIATGRKTKCGLNFLG